MVQDSAAYSAGDTVTLETRGWAHVSRATLLGQDGVTSSTRRMSGAASYHLLPPEIGGAQCSKLKISKIIL